MTIRLCRPAAALVGALGLLSVFAADGAGQGRLSPEGVNINRGREAPESTGIVDLQRLSGPVEVNGLSDEAAWAGVEPLPLTMYEPEFRGESQRRIQVLVAYDDQALYVASRFFHDDPDEKDAVRDAAPSGYDAGRFVFDWTRRRFQGLSYQNVFVWSGPGYDPDVGFEERTDFRRVQSDWNYQWFPGLESPWRRIWLGLESNAWVRNVDDAVDTGQFRPFLTLETNDGLSMTVNTNTQFEDVPADFSLSDDATVPAGMYWATEGAFRFEAPRGWGVRPNVTVTVGQFFDGRRLAVEHDFDWPVGAHLQLRGGWEWNRIRFLDRDQAFDSNLLRLTARAALDTHLSVNLFAQYNSLTDRIATNARLRYNFSEGQDLWLVWNEGLNVRRDPLGVPRLPRSEARILSVKYTHTLIL